MKRNVAKKVAGRKRRVLKRLERAREQRFIRGLDSTSVLGEPVNLWRSDLADQSVGRYKGRNEQPNIRQHIQRTRSI